MTRAVIYVRLSREDSQGQAATESKFDSRITTCHELAQRHALTVTPEDIYIEQESGGSLANRPKILKILNLARTKQITHVITPYYDRLSRGDKRDAQDIEDAFLDGEITLLTTEGVTVYDESYHERHGMTADVLEMLARFYKRDVSRKMKNANIERAKQGKRGGRVPPYGYIWHKPEYADKTLITPEYYEIVGTLTLTNPAAALSYATENAPACLDGENLNEPRYIALARRQGLPDGSLLPGVTCTGGEYAIVCEVYRRIAHEGRHVIARDLNERGETNPGASKGKPGRWHTYTISHMVANPHYAGYPTRRFTKGRKGENIALPQDQWVYPDTKLPYPHPITLDAQETLIAKTKERSKGGVGSRPSSPNWLGGVIYCAEGRRLKRTTNTYACDCITFGKRHKGRAVTMHRAESAAAKIIETVITSLPENFTLLQSPQSPAAADTTAELRRRRRDLEDARKTRALFERTGSLPAWESTISQLETEICTLEQQIAASRSPAVSLDQERLSLIGLLRSLPFSEFWQEALPHERRAILVMFVERIQIIPQDEYQQRVRRLSVTLQEWVRPFCPLTEVTIWEPKQR